PRDLHQPRLLLGRRLARVHGRVDDAAQHLHNGRDQRQDQGQGHHVPPRTCTPTTDPRRLSSVTSDVMISFVFLVRAASLTATADFHSCTLLGYACWNFRANTAQSRYCSGVTRLASSSRL